MAKKTGIIVDKDYHVWKAKSLDTLRITPTAKLFDRSREGNFSHSIQQFFIKNRKAFDFLEITPTLAGDGFEQSIILNTGKYSGVVPLQDPKTGKTTILLCVQGRYSEDLYSLLPEVQKFIEPEFNTSMVLPAQPPIEPPILLDCFKFISSFLKTPFNKWRKFNNEILNAKAPKASTLWVDYAIRSTIDPNQRLRFKNKENNLINDHIEKRQLNYALKIAVDNVTMNSVPFSTRARHTNDINQAKSIISHQGIATTDYIPIHAHDSCPIKLIKQKANDILIGKAFINQSWRIDLALVFERFVQHVFSEFAKKNNLRFALNPRYGIHGSRPAWGLNYLEPDMVLLGDDSILVVDAKYKSYMMNYDSNTSQMKDDYRHDLHQVLCYLALETSRKLYVNKKAILVCPATQMHIKRSNINGIEMVMIGLPLDSKIISDFIHFF